MTFQYEFVIYAILLAAALTVMVRNRLDRSAKPRAAESPPRDDPAVAPTPDHDDIIAIEQGLHRLKSVVGDAAGVDGDWSGPRWDRPAGVWRIEVGNRGNASIAIAVTPAGRAEATLIVGRSKGTTIVVDPSLEDLRELPSPSIHRRWPACGQAIERLAAFHGYTMGRHLAAQTGGPTTLPDVVLVPGDSSPGCAPAVNVFDEHASAESKRRVGRMAQSPPSPELAAWRTSHPRDDPAAWEAYHARGDLPAPWPWPTPGPMATFVVDTAKVGESAEDLT